jgi:hypothetical protein
MNGPTGKPTVRIEQELAPSPAETPVKP